MDEIEGAYKKWVHAMKYESPSKIFDAKQDLIQRVREQFEDSEDRSRIYATLLDAAVEELDSEEAH